MLDHKINTFIAAVELHSYTAAAEALHLTQPAVTQHIKKLEEYYGQKLIDFSGRSVMLTAAGRELYQYAHIQKNNEKLLVEKLAGCQETLRIGATLSIADYYLPEVFGSYFESEHRLPSLTVGNTESLAAKLVDGKLDCAFLEGLFDSGLFEAHEFCQAEFVPVAVYGHPLSNTAADLRQLQEFPLILREKGSGTRAVLEAYLYQQNTSASAFAGTEEAGSFEVIKCLLAKSNAVSFMYEAVVRKELEERTLQKLKLRHFWIKRPLHFIYLKGSLKRDQYELFFKQIGRPKACGNR